jgi:hypothetical protein
VIDAGIYLRASPVRGMIDFQIIETRGKRLKRFDNAPYVVERMVVRHCNLKVRRNETVSETMAKREPGLFCMFDGGVLLHPGISVLGPLSDRPLRTRR